MTLIDSDVLRRQIQLLDEVAFVSLCNSLLIESAVHNNIDRNCFRLNQNTKEGDGGVDAACVNAQTTVQGIIPRTSTNYQFKSGRGYKYISEIVKTDILAKPRVLAGLKQGDGFVYMAGWDRSDSIDENILKELRITVPQIEDGQVLFVGAEMLAHRMAAFPALIHRYFPLPLDSVFEFDRWSKSRTMSNAFVADADVSNNIEALRARIETPGSLVRLVGSAGDGKTRMVLETLRASDLKDTVLYAGQPEDVKGQLANHLMGARDLKCTLVIDEVDDRATSYFENWFEGRPSGVRLVLIGLDATGKPQPNTLQVSGLSNPLLAELINTIVPGMPEEISKAIAEDCERSPKLAVLIASRIRDDPGLVRAKVLSDRRVQNTLNAYLPIETSQIGWRALAATSLLMRLGWADEAEEESTMVFGLLSLDVADARREVKNLHDRFGIAPVAGRFRYVSPAILADHLAVGEISAWTRKHIQDFFDALTPAMAESFSRRARRLSAVLSNATVVEEVILGDQGPFRSLTDIEEGGSAIILRQLAAPYPQAAIAAIARIVENATLDELRAATNSRREMVWALQELLWPTGTFEKAAEMLLRLAIAENESWDNNASNIWPQTFQTFLGGTEAGWESRIRVVRAASRNESVHARVLAARAVKAAFETQSVSRMGAPPVADTGMPLKEWQPELYKDWWDSLIAYLEILDELLGDQSQLVRTEAAETIGSTVSDLFNVGERVALRWMRATQKLRGADFALKSEILKSIGWALERWEMRQHEFESVASADDPSDAGKAENAAAKAAVIAARLQMLRQVEASLVAGDSSTEFRRAVSRTTMSRTRGLSHEEAEQTIREELETYAVQMISKPLTMEAEWTWLLDDKEWRGAERWIEVLGELDVERIFEVTLEQLAVQFPRAMMWLSLYDIVHAANIEDPTFIDTRARLYVNRSQFAQTTDLIRRAGLTPARIEMLLDLFEQRRIPPVALNQFAFVSWTALSSVNANRLLEGALGASDKPAELIQFISTFLNEYPAESSVIRESAMKVLADAAQDSGRDDDSYQWSKVAEAYVKTDAAVIASLALKRVAAQETSHDGSLNDTIRTVWEIGNKLEIFSQVISPWLDGSYLNSFWVRATLQTIRIEDAGVSFLMNWVRENPSSRAYILAETIQSPALPFTELQAALLTEFSDEGVGSAFFSRFMSGVWTGSESNWVRSKLNRAQQWAQDTRESVKFWAERMIPSLETDLRRAEAREAEERFR